MRERDIAPETAEPGKQLYAIRLGSLALLLDEPEEVEAKAYGDALSRIIPAMNETVSQAPVVVADPMGHFSDDSFSLFRIPLNGNSRWAVQFTSPLRIKAHWPRKNQELLFLDEYEGPCVETFDITYDGFSFVVAASCDEPLPYTYSYYFGREARRILEHLLGNSDVYQLKGFGPTPIFPILYVVVANVLSDLPLGREPIWRGDTLETVHHLPLARFEHTGADIGQISRTLLYPMGVLGKALATHAEIAYQEHQLYLHFGDAAKLHGAAAEPFPRNPRGWISRLHESMRLRRAIGHSYSHYVGVEEARGQAREDITYVAEQFSKHPLLEPHKDYGRDVLQADFRWEGSHILEALRFYSEDVRSRSLQSATVIGPVSGGLIAIVATVLALLLS